MMANHKPGVARQNTDPQTEDRLDQELEQTFPASDAPQITRDPPPHPGGHRRPNMPPVRDQGP
jgi:hypothetical protein